MTLHNEQYDSNIVYCLRVDKNVRPLQPYNEQCYNLNTAS